ncbi:MAG: succinate dehydrogenase, hydrophobic membrane anchor protein [Anaerolineae bacterium]
MYARRLGRPVSSSNFELYAWLFMRVSGVLLLVLALLHFTLMHFVIGVDNIDFNAVAQRWSTPFWRMYDFFLLAFALLHGLNGARTVMDDYIHAHGWRVVATSILYVVGFALISMGAYIIFTFRVPA